jgi:F0F1-type ATP synthase gamma subunit
MSADNATRNAGDNPQQALIYNRTRQAMIARS